MGSHTTFSTAVPVRVLVVSTGEPNDGVFLPYDKIGGSNVPMIVVTGAT